MVLLLCLLFIQDARSAESLDQAGAILARVSGAKVRSFSTRDFGREQYSQARSILVPEARAPALLKAVREQLPAGFVAFIGTVDSLAEPPVEGAELVVAPGRDQFDILRVAAADAANYDMLTDDLIRELQTWHREFGIDIWQAETDSIGLDLQTVPEGVEAFARRVFIFCPDIVVQVAGKSSDLARYIRQEKRLLLWWD